MVSWGARNQVAYRSSRQGFNATGYGVRYGARRRDQVLGKLDYLQDGERLTVVETT